jgi:hypothetical protein
MICRPLLITVLWFYLNQRERSAANDQGSTIMSEKSGSVDTLEIDGKTYSYVEEVQPGVSGWKLQDPDISANTASTYIYTCYSEVYPGVQYWQSPGASRWTPLR